MEIMVLLVWSVITLILQPVIANNCKNSVSYCGYNLLNIGNYKITINEALQKVSLDPNNKGIASNTLFRCVGNNGDIEVINFCTYGCVDGGSGGNDTCHLAPSLSPSRSSTSSGSPSLAPITVTLPSLTPSATISITSTPSSGNNSSGNTPVGAIVGGVVGGVAALAVIFLGIFMLLKKSRKRQQPLDESVQESSSRQGVSEKYEDAPKTQGETATYQVPTGFEHPGHEIYEAPGSPTQTRYELG